MLLYMFEENHNCEMCCNKFAFVSLVSGTFSLYAKNYAHISFVVTTNV